MVSFDMNPDNSLLGEGAGTDTNCRHVMSRTTVAVMFLLHRWDHLRTLNRAMDCLLDIVLTHDELCSIDEDSQYSECFVCETVREFNPVEAVECLTLNQFVLEKEFGESACQPLDHVVYDADSAFGFDHADMDLDGFCQAVMERCVDEQSLVHGLHTVLRGVVADDLAARQRFDTLLVELGTGSDLAGETFFRNELVSGGDDRCWLLDRGWSSYRLHCQVMDAMKAYWNQTAVPAE